MTRSGNGATGSGANSLLLAYVADMQEDPFSCVTLKVTPLRVRSLTD